jgi:hypothetical protein
MYIQPYEMLNNFLMTGLWIDCAFSFIFSSFFLQSHCGFCMFRLYQQHTYVHMYICTYKCKQVTCTFYEYVPSW